jgi:hypothetical protein
MSGPPRRRPLIDKDEAAAGGLGGVLANHRAGIGAVAVAGAVAIAGWYAWSRYGVEAGTRPDMILFPEAVEVVGLAPWVPTGLDREALRNASLDGGLPLDDPELPQRLERAFLMHPWVRDVVRVELRHPAGAVVTVACREPVAMVVWQGGLLAVDAEGVVLPSADFTAESAAAYPKVAGVTSSPLGLEGSRWGDPVVDEAAAVAAAVGPDWKTLELREIRPVVTAGRRGWELVATGPRTVFFGSTPGREADGEPTAAVKLVRLRAAGFPGSVSEEGRLDLTEPADTAAPGD